MFHAAERGSNLHHLINSKRISKPSLITVLLSTYGCFSSFIYKEQLWPLHPLPFSLIANYSSLVSYLLAFIFKEMLERLIYAENTNAEIRDICPMCFIALT